MGQARKDYNLGMFWFLEDLEPEIIQKSQSKVF